jgi:hypothetical protein
MCVCSIDSVTIKRLLQVVCYILKLSAHTVTLQRVFRAQDRVMCSPIERKKSERLAVHEFRTMEKWHIGTFRNLQCWMWTPILALAVNHLVRKCLAWNVLFVGKVLTQGLWRQGLCDNTLFVQQMLLAGRMLCNWLMIRVTTCGGPVLRERIILLTQELG